MRRGGCDATGGSFAGRIAVGSCGRAVAVRRRATPWFKKVRGVVLSLATTARGCGGSFLLISSERHDDLARTIRIVEGREDCLLDYKQYDVKIIGKMAVLGFGGRICSRWGSCSCRETIRKFF